MILKFIGSSYIFLVYNNNKATYNLQIHYKLQWASSLYIMISIKTLLESYLKKIHVSRRFEIIEKKKKNKKNNTISRTHIIKIITN